MNISKAHKGLLFVSGLIATGIGAATLFAPVAFLGTSSIDLGSQVNLLSEVRAPAGALLAGGIVILSGIFVNRLTFTSTVIAALMFLSYGVGRVLSVAVDGVPADAIVGATALEIVIGLAALFMLVRGGETQPTGYLQTQA